MYTKIADYGLIGNCRSSALVSKWGSIDWSCLPDFDSPAIFLKNLDSQKGGYFAIHPVGFYQSSQFYKENTNILKTDFFNSSGRVLLTDFMPISKKDEEEGSIPIYGWKFLRRVKAKLGNHKVRIELKVTPNYALETLEPKFAEGETQYFLGETRFVLSGFDDQAVLKKGVLSCEFDLAEGEERFFAFGFFQKDAENGFSVELAKTFYQETLDFWSWWASLCRYQGAFREEVLRSALTLKLLTFAPTGAVIAAPTTSLPEKLGGSLNWDYRYVWLRDASFTMFAFLGLGYLKEAVDFMNWLEEVCLEEGTLQIMYGLHGEKALKERRLNHLSGYEDSKPVRIGNEAYKQKQFDIFGEVLSCLNIYVSCGGQLNQEMKGFIARLVEMCIKSWRDKDAGIWESRGEKKHYTYSKLNCWVGLDRGISLAKKLSLKVDLDRWESERDKVKADILENGFDKELNAFVEFYGSGSVGSSILNIPLLGFLPSDDPRVQSSLDIVMSSLSHDWFIYRTSDESDKLKEGEGTFFLSTFWVIDNLAMAGRSKEAKIWLEKIIHFSSSLGLYGEMFDPVVKEHLGNFPQAFTHLGLINSVLNLDQAMRLGADKGALTKAERLSRLLSSMNRGLDTTLENVLPYTIRKTLSEKQRRRTAKRSLLERFFKRS